MSLDAVKTILDFFKAWLEFWRGLAWPVAAFAITVVVLMSEVGRALAASLREGDLKAKLLGGEISIMRSQSAPERQLREDEKVAQLTAAPQEEPAPAPRPQNQQPAHEGERPPAPGAAQQNEAPMEPNAERDALEIEVDPIRQQALGAVALAVDSIEREIGHALERDVRLGVGHRQHTFDAAATVGDTLFAVEVIFAPRMNLSVRMLSALMFSARDVTREAREVKGLKVILYVVVAVGPTTDRIIPKSEAYALISAEAREKGVDVQVRFLNLKHLSAPRDQ